MSKDITKEINKADKTSRKLTSFWYRVKEGVKDMVIPDKYRSDYVPPKSETGIEQGDKSEQPRMAQSDISHNYKVNNNLDRDEKGMTQFQKQESELDDCLDELCGKVINIKGMAKDASN